MTAVDESISTWGSGFLPQHRAALEGSAVDPEVARARGYRSVTEKATLERAGFSQAQIRVPGLLVPLWNVHGANAGYQYRPDSPRRRSGKPIKYETRAGQPSVVDVPPSVAHQMGDPSVPLWITEGSKKADAAVSAGLCCVSLSGVWNWRGTNAAGGKVALPDFDSIALNGRKIVLCFDSDATANTSVYDALARLRGYLEGREAEVWIAHLPDGADGSKVGLDDHIAAHQGERLVDTIAVDRSLGERPHAPRDVPVGVDGHHLTDAGNADRLVGSHGERLRFVPQWGQWLVWEDGVWKIDHRDTRVVELAKDVARGLWRNVADMEPGKARDRHITWAKASEGANAITNAVKLARGVPGVAIGHADLDADPWMLNTPSGVIDLRTGVLGPHDPEQLHTRMTGTWWDPTATAPRWDAFLERVLPDIEVRSFVHRATGYSLTGSVAEQVLFLLIGDGNNGKSTFVEIITKVIGDYAGTAPKDLLVTQRHDPHPTSAADLFRLRFAAAVETEATNQLAEAQVKSLTGGDTIKARRMREDFWSFTPTHKLWIAANHLPRISGTDHGIWRRIRLVPFTVTIPATEVDPHLKDALLEELPGILRWAVDGCIAWQAEGLTPPSSVVAATEEYRLESDWFSAWTTEAGIQLDPGAWITVKDVTASYRDWCIGNGEVPANRQVFAKELRKRGCKDVSNGSARIWRGIGRQDL